MNVYVRPVKHSVRDWCGMFEWQTAVHDFMTREWREEVILEECTVINPNTQAKPFPKKSSVFFHSLFMFVHFLLFLAHFCPPSSFILFFLCLFVFLLPSFFLLLLLICHTHTNTQHNFLFMVTETKECFEVFYWLFPYKATDTRTSTDSIWTWIKPQLMTFI